MCLMSQLRDFSLNKNKNFIKLNVITYNIISVCSQVQIKHDTLSTTIQPTCYMPLLLKLPTPTTYYSSVLDIKIQEKIQIHKFTRKNIRKNYKSQIKMEVY